MKIIGLTGTNASGKTEVAEYLKRQGFAYYSLSDILREEATRRGLDHSRQSLIKLGNSLRKKHGAGILAKMVKEKLKRGVFVIDSIRNPKEIEELRMPPADFLLLGIDAPVEIRFKRALKRGRAGEGKTLEQFIENERLENSKNKESQQLSKCLKMADKLIINDGTKKELYRKIEKAYVG